MDIELEAKRQDLLNTVKAAARDQLKPLALVLGSSVAADAVANAIFAALNVLTGGEGSPVHVDQPLEVAPLTSGSDHIPDEHLVAATTLPPVVEPDPVEAVSEAPQGVPPVSELVEPDPVEDVNEPIMEAPVVTTQVEAPHGDALDPSDVDGCGFCGAVPPTPYHGVNCSRPVTVDPPSSQDA